jgi:hypothetical protein
LSFQDRRDNVPKCDKCGKQFGSAHGLKVHIGRQHGGRRPAKAAGRKKSGAFICDICGRSFGMAMHLGRHKSFAHPARKKVGRPPMAAPAAVSAGLDVGSLDIDQLVSLKHALDARLAEIARKLQAANVRS